MHKVLLRLTLPWIWAIASQANAASTPSVLTSDRVNPADQAQADLTIQAIPTTQWTGLWTRPTLLGDLGGLRSALGRYGITLGLSETSEELANVSGGLKTGAAYDGLSTLTLGMDTQQAFAWQGGAFNLSLLNLHGNNLSAADIGSLQTASGIEADRGTRLWELWYQQQFDQQQWDLKLGQQSLDQEFMVSHYAATFINTMFGWPALPSYDMPAGGPAYPLSDLGLRLRLHASDKVTLLAGVFDGNPAGTTQGDPQQEDAHGDHFNLKNGRLAIVEWQYDLNQPVLGQLDRGPGSGQASGLPGSYKIGAWYNSENFADERNGSDGLSLANPLSNGQAQQHRGDYSIYAVADQMLWRPGEDSARILGAFVRLMGAPGDRNPLSFSANSGLTLAAPFDGRDNDVAGLGIGYVQAGSHSIGLQQDSNAYSAQQVPLQSNETIAEATYQYQFTPWWQLQGDVQYIWNTGGGIPSPSHPSQKVGNSLLFGLRTSITL
jgi:porin